ncbi:MAG TPA: hypothetical protein VN442_17815 [Bryobacteraceae bacterium]|nr:hypothetical protein [Bryobacteraceae bacterium]
MRIVYSLLALALASGLMADTLTLRSGRVVNGTYLGGTSRQVRMEVGDRIETFQVGDVATLEFTAGASTAAPVSAPAAAVEPARPRLQRSENVMRPARPAAPAATVLTTGIEIPAGTEITVRMIDSVDSEKNNVGQTFQASLDDPILVAGKTVVPRGADVVVKLVDDKESGKLTGRAELALDLVSLKVDGRVVDIQTQAITRASESRTGRTAQMATGGAALGAIIGAIAGGGKGAAIGAVSGAGAGTAVQVVTKGQKVQIPSETRLTFTLDVPVKL